MIPRNALTLQTQLMLPLIPFIIDTFARGLLLRNKIDWFQIPDLVTLLVTYAFFCLGLMFTVHPHHIRTDEDAEIKVQLVRQRLLANAIFAVSFAGGISFFRAFDEMHPEHNLYNEHGFALFIVVALFVAYGLIRISRTYLSYVNRGA